jgi:ABC-type glycerol-3-phosphate transport system substrate-binding protein
MPLVLGNAVSSGRPPEIAALPQPGLLRELVAGGRVKPVDGAAAAQVSSNLAPLWRNLVTVNGKPYGVYFKASNKSTVWYSPRAFRQAGIAQPPVTIDELLQDMGSLRRAGITPFAMCGASGWTLTDWFENVYLQTAGADKYESLTRHDIPWTDPTVTTAFTLLGRILGDPSNMLGGLQGAISTPYPDCVSQVFGRDAGAAMVFEGDFVQGAIQALGLSLQAGRGADYDFFRFPHLNPGAPESVVVGGDVAVMLRDTPQARELIDYLATPAAGQIWARQGGFISPNRKVDLAAYPDDTSRAAAREITQRGARLVFDMSDQAPAAFGSTVGSGELADLQRWLAAPGDIQGTQAALERDARAAYP